VGKGELDVVVVVVELDPGALEGGDEGVPLFEIGVEPGALELMEEERVGTGELERSINEPRILPVEIGAELGALGIIEEGRVATTEL